MRPLRILASTAALGALLALPAAAPAAHNATDQHSANLSLVTNVPYPAKNGTVPNFGTDIEFGEIGGVEYAFAGSYRNGLQIVDITEPTAPRIAGVYDCGVTQGDVQVFRRADKPGRTFVTYTSDTVGDGTSTCYQEAAALGFDVKKPNGQGKNGTFIADVTDPANPVTVSFVEVAQGSHNMTVHPSGRFLYNSNSDLITSPLPAIEIFDVTDFANPRLAKELALPTRPGLGTESHDIAFSRDGSRAYSAALSQGVIIDSTKPADPTVITSFVDPTINVWHQLEPVTVDGKTFLIAEDEFAGAVGTGQCPNGGLHIYDITGTNELNPVKVGYWNIDTVGPTFSPTDSCTAHVLDIQEKENIMTLAFYNGGVRVVDLGGLAGIGLGTTSTSAGLRQIGFYRAQNANAWSAKTPKIQGNGDFYLYGNDIRRGLDVFKFDAAKAKSAQRGTWKAGTSAERMFAPGQALALDGDPLLSYTASELGPVHAG